MQNISTVCVSIYYILYLDLNLQKHNGLSKNCILVVASVKQGEKGKIKSGIREKNTFICLFLEFSVTSANFFFSQSFLQTSSNTDAIITICLDNAVYNCS